MVARSVSLRGSLSNSLLHRLLQYFHGNVGKFKSARSCSTAIWDGLDESPVVQNEGNGKGIDFLYLMEERGIRANVQTYLWLFEGCLNSGSLFDYSWKSMV